MRFKRKLHSAKHLFAQTVAPWGLLKNDPEPSPDLDGGGSWGPGVVGGPMCGYRVFR